MALYLDTKVQNPEAGCININLEWHQQYCLLAVASYSQEKGGFVTIYDDLGEVIPGVSWPQHSVAQVTALAWHPAKKLLVIGWENGELQSWAGDSEFVSLQSLHQTPITILQWSFLGGRLVSGDTAGSLVGSKVDARGQILAVFHHELKRALTHIVFRHSSKYASQGLDISGLARAAVAGDEKALDMFSAWRPRTAGHRMVHTGHGDNFCFYVGSVSGSLYYFTDEGTCTEVLNTEGTMLKKMLFHEHKDNLIVMTEDLNIGQFQVHADGQLTELMKVKLNGKPQDAAVVWAGHGTLAVTTGDLMIRCWDLDTGDSYILEGADDTTASTTASNMPTEIFTSLSFCPQKRILSGGTNLGNILMWRFVAVQISGRESPSSGPSGGDPAQNWRPEPPCNVRGAVKQLAWSDAHMLLAVNTITTVFILHEHELKAHCSNKIVALQQSASQLLVELELKEKGNYHSLELTTDLQVKGVAVAMNYVAVWSSKTLVVYELIVDGVGDDARITSKVTGSFTCEVETAFLHDQSVLVLLKDQSAVELRTLQGTVKQSLLTSDVEGKPIGMQLCGPFLTVITAAGYIKIWDLTRREAKLHTNPKNLEEVVDDFGEIILAISNCNGTKVSISVAKSNFLPSPKLYVWDIESDNIQFYNLATGKLNENEDSDELQAASLEENKYTTIPIADVDFNISGRFPLLHRWDEEEPRLLVCESKRFPNPEGKTSWPRRVSSSTVIIPTSENSKSLHNAEVILVTFFTAPDSEEILLQDVTPLENETQLLAVSTPHFLLLCRPSVQQHGSRLAARTLKRMIMREFEGLQHCDKSTRDAVLNFSYNLRTGNMDEAFRAIKTIHSEAVWENLARMCVKTKRLDVAFVCLGHMKHVRGAMALREAMKEPELEARVGMLAIQLGLNAEAERLYASCGRWDLVNCLHQAAEEWDQALRIAEEHDRIHLRSTYFNYAGHLESKGDISGAAHMYEQAGVHTMQVPRMLLDDQCALEQYVLKSKDPQLVKWWGQYMESTGNMDAAMQYYEQAHDYFSLVRVLCFQENITRAAEIASTTGDKAACYHLARQYETMGNITEAIHFFTRAQAYGNAVRICKEQGMEDQLWNLALLAGPREQLEAARYFESNEKAWPEKAVLLYHRAGMLHKALDLAFKSREFSALQLIALDLTSTSDPTLVQKCAHFFVENGEYEKAVDLLAVGKQYVEALELCVEHNIPITEDLAEKLTINKGEGDEKMRIQVLEKVAESALAQGNYHLATKKFTQAGNKVAAMKALLKSGDTEKIIFFANVSRQREIYVMAANYLQSLDWQSQPDVLKNIVAFYSKGRAPELLANFYTACAQVEIDEYQNYEKALGALGEANRSLAKVTNPADPLQHKRAVENLNARMTLVKKFVDVKRLAERGDHKVTVTQCRQLLQQHEDLEAAVRVGDVYGLMVETLMAEGDVQGAGTLLEEWRAHVGTGVNLAYYLAANTIDKLSRELGLPLLSRGANSLQQHEKLSNEPEEEIEEVEENSGVAK